MAETFLLEVVTPERLVLQEQVEEMSAPGALGEFGVLPGHTPFFTILRPGPVTYRRGRERHQLAVSWGFAEVGPDKVVLLAETAELAHEIDLRRAEARVRETEEQIREMSVADPAYEAVRGSLEKALARLQVLRGRE